MRKASGKWSGKEERKRGGVRRSRQSKENQTHSGGHHQNFFIPSSWTLERLILAGWVKEPEARGSIRYLLSQVSGDSGSGTEVVVRWRRGVRALPKPYAQRPRGLQNHVGGL